MALTMYHRGPDDAGEWADASAGFALGFRRLAIVDLSPEGHQPMISPCGRYVVAFNGEIYNFQELRAELEQSGWTAGFRGHSDTEVLLAAISTWGLDSALRRFVGMFAIALWDRRERILNLVRDRLGIKPLYYGWNGSTFLFGSELKALAAHPHFSGEIDREALTLFLRYSYVPTPYSIYKGIRKLTPGTRLAIPLDSLEMPRPVPFWSAKEVAERGAADPFTGSNAEAIERLDEVIRESVRLRMIADVPLGAFLSWGVDSSTVVALMQAQSTRAVRTFSIGFHEAGYNEAEHAGAVARHLGTDHTELYVSAGEAMQVIPRIPAMYDEPFADSSQIPTYLVSRLAREHVTVSLSGDGGDELFAGYNRYAWARSLWKGLGFAPRGLRVAASRALSSFSAQRWDQVFGALDPVLPARARQRLPGDKIIKLAEVLGAANPEELYQSLVSCWKQPEQVVLGGAEPPTALTDSRCWADLPDLTQRMRYLDTIMYLPDDILTKVDRASMAVSLEARVPLLDHRVAEFAWSIPTATHLKGGQSKWLLRQVLYRYVPQDLIERPKMGFGVPINDWLRGPLRDWAEALLDPCRLESEGFFHSEPIRRKWAEHLSGRQNWQYYLWNVLMFQSWREANIHAVAGAALDYVG